MQRIEIANEQIRRAVAQANEMGAINNSIRKGEGNVIGFLGEIVLADYIGAKQDNTYQYDLVTLDGTTIDVKTKHCTSEPRDYYECSIANFNTTQKCDIYAFVRILLRNELIDCAYLLGYLSPKAYYSKARFLRKGTKDGDNNFVVRADCHNVAISELTPFDPAKLL